MYGKHKIKKKKVEKYKSYNLNHQNNILIFSIRYFSDTPCKVFFNDKIYYKL